MQIRVLLFLCFYSTCIFSQTIPDSLYKQVKGEIDSVRLKALLQLSKTHSSIDPDSGIWYGKQAFLLAEEMEDERNKAWALNYIGSTFYYHGDYDSARQYHERALQIRLRIGDKKGLGASYNNLGNIYDDEGNPSQALEYYQKAQRYFEEIGFRTGMAITYNSIGNLHYNRKDYHKALDYFHLSYNIHEKNLDTFGLIHAVNNMAIMYDELNDKKKALECYHRSLEMAERSGYTDAIMTCYTNLAQIYMNMGDFGKSEQYMRKGVKLNESYGDSTHFISLYSNFAMLHRKKGNLDSAIYYCQLSQPIAIRTGLLASVAYNYQFLSEVYAKQGKFKIAYDMHRLYSLTTDTVLNEENSRQVSEMETRFETAKKDKEIIQRNAEIKKAESESASHTLQRNALIGGLVVLLAFTIYIIYSFRKKRRAHQIMAEQKHIIEEKQRDILDSIHYARRIQRSLLPNEKFIFQTLKRLQA